MHTVLQSFCPSEPSLSSGSSSLCDYIGRINFAAVSSVSLADIPVSRIWTETSGQRNWVVISVAGD